MKKTVSFSLEEDIIEAIEKYKEDNNLSSRSVALERMILNLSAINEKYIKEIIQKYINTAPVKFKNKIEEKNILDDAIKDSYSNMPD